ncbi:MAG: hypothetical protein JSV80_02305 [Acidobacteriota bacterium]|nr:MAG: hypothetical protein JSV80_02305 [Acidobacteriota bacterium]
MRITFVFRLTGCLASASALAMAASVGGEPERSSIAIEVVATTPALEAKARRLARDAPAVLKRVSDRLQLEPPPRVLVLLAPSVPTTRLEKDQLGVGDVPVWSAGIAQPRRGRVVLFADRFGVYPHLGLTGLLAHEATHIVFGFHLTEGASVPRWYEEGLAMVVERDLSIYDALELTRLVILGEPLPLERLSHSWPSDASFARTAYAESLSFVSMAEENAPPGAARRLTFGLAEGQGFARAFERAYGLSPEALEYLWRKRLRWRYLTIPIVVAGATINGLIAFLVVTASVLARRRRRLLLEEWERTEGPAPPLDQLVTPETGRDERFGPG